MVYWLLAAIDGHAKNFSLFIEEAGRYRLTPRYDVLSAFPVVGHGTGQLHEREIKMAMAVWGKSRHYKWFDIQRRHWGEAARQCGLGADVDSVVAELAVRVPDVLERVRGILPAGFPDGVAEPILAGIRRSSERLSRGSSSV